MYNDALVILRELCFSVPDVAHRLFAEEIIVFLFTLMGHPSFFDHSVGLIEEILADQVYMYRCMERCMDVYRDVCMCVCIG